MIGSSLEAAVEIQANPDTYGFLKPYESDLSALFIVSGVKLKEVHHLPEKPDVLVTVVEGNGEEMRALLELSRGGREQCGPSDALRPLRGGGAVKRGSRYLLLALIAVTVIILDQATKYCDHAVDAAA